MVTQNFITSILPKISKNTLSNARIMIHLMRGWQSAPLSVRHTPREAALGIREDTADGAHAAE